MSPAAPPILHLPVKPPFKPPIKPPLNPQVVRHRPGGALPLALRRRRGAGGGGRPQPAAGLHGPHHAAAGAQPRHQQVRPRHGRSHLEGAPGQACFGGSLGLRVSYINEAPRPRPISSVPASPSLMCIELKATSRSSKCCRRKPDIVGSFCRRRCWLSTASARSRASRCPGSSAPS